MSTPSVGTRGANWRGRPSDQKATVAQSAWNWCVSRGTDRRHSRLADRRCRFISRNRFPPCILDIKFFRRPSTSLRRAASCVWVASLMRAFLFAEPMRACSQPPPKNLRLPRRNFARYRRFHLKYRSDDSALIQASFLAFWCCWHPSNIIQLVYNNIFVVAY